MHQPNLHTTFTLAHETATSPELRRMQMINQARRDELEIMIYGEAPRKQRLVSQQGRTTDSFIGRTLNNVRDGIGSALISAGNRIQSA